MESFLLNVTLNVGTKLTTIEKNKLFVWLQKGLALYVIPVSVIIGFVK